MTHTGDFIQMGLLSGRPRRISSQAGSSNPIQHIVSSGLSIAEKRELLSAWASDARAVPDAPALRKLDTGTIVDIDDILDALKTLDSPGLEARVPEQAESMWGLKRLRRNGWVPAVFRGRRTDDDDDDPPPCPAVIAPLPRHPPSGAEASLQAA